MAVIRVQQAPFDVGAEIAAITSGHCDIGGIGCFIGQVRGDGGVVALTLEHYPGMTEQALGRIAAEAEARWSLLGCTIVHRHGRLTVAEPIVLVIAAASHRQPAIDATSFLIDWLKTEAPFWKCTEYGDGRREWVASRAADADARDAWLRR